jgi:hypothetical protein
MFVYCVLSGRGLCDELITRPEESYRLWRVVVCDQETSRTSWAAEPEKKIILFHNISEKCYKTKLKNILYSRVFLQWIKRDERMCFRPTHGGPRCQVGFRIWP